MPKVYQSCHIGDADVRIAMVDRGSADLLVHRVSSQGLAQGDWLWFITGNRQDADVVVSVTSQGMAQLNVCFVDTYGEAGWRGPRPALLPW